MLTRWNNSHRTELRIMWFMNINIRDEIYWCSELLQKQCDAFHISKPNRRGNEQQVPHFHEKHNFLRKFRFSIRKFLLLFSLNTLNFNDLVLLNCTVFFRPMLCPLIFGVRNIATYSNKLFFTTRLEFIGLSLLHMF